MTNSIIKARNIRIGDSTHIDGRSFGLIMPINIATCAAEQCYGRTTTYLGKNDAGLFFFKNIEGETIAVDIEPVDLIKVYKVKVAA